MSVCTEDQARREKTSTNNVHNSTEAEMAPTKPSITDKFCAVDGLDTKQVIALNLHKINTPEAMGETLARVRCAKSLTLENVSRQTNISIARLQALESGQKPSLAPAYIRGYLKAYAEFLGVDCAFLSSSSGASRCHNTVQSEKSISSSSADSNNRFIRSDFRIGSSWSRGGLSSPLGLLRGATSAALPLLMLCVLAFAYHAIDTESNVVNESASIAALEAQNSKLDQLGPLAHEAVGSPVATTSQLPDVLARSSLSTQLEDVKTVASELQTVQAGVQPSAIVNNSVASTALASLQISQGSPERSVVTSNPIVSDDAPIERLAAPVLVTNEPERTNTAITLAEERMGDLIMVGQFNGIGESRATIPNAGIEDSYEPIGPRAVEMIAQVQMQDRLVITVYEDSWVDVTDSYGVRLYRDLAKAGRRIDVSGNLPFSLHVGNAPGLELQLNGESVEITRYRSDNSARLTLASN